VAGAAESHEVVEIVGVVDDIKQTDGLDVVNLQTAADIIFAQRAGLAGEPIPFTGRSSAGLPIGSVIGLVTSAPRRAHLALDERRLPRAHTRSATEVVRLDLRVLPAEVFAAPLAVSDHATATEPGRLARAGAVQSRVEPKTVGLRFERAVANRAADINLRSLGILVAGVRTEVKPRLAPLDVVRVFQKRHPALAALDRDWRTWHVQSPSPNYTQKHLENKGTTLIAAHRLGRVCYGCEIEPKYGDVILRRAEAEGLACEKAG
jgi:hypothetical protein